ncbi:hypothetical protein DW970_12775 [Clostridium sp. AM48-13]|nr:hypothetical protein DW023_10405 [Clostridium sp. AF37-7]RHP56028.1 hypothetical protein DWZ16_13245 [Clostridium sp. AF29-8BH]RHQ16050.1 hypothetical protein DW970_12775 [Clostridium sp. AM48-13]RHV72631.1 hypothetical protein DXB05_10555 [Clostridium sp. OF13-4]
MIRHCRKCGFDKIYDFWQLSEKNQKQEKMEIKILNKIYKNTCFFETAMLYLQLSEQFWMGSRVAKGGRL